MNSLKSSSKGKHHRYDVRQYFKNISENVTSLINELENSSYKLSPYKTKIIKDKSKERVLSIAPYHDRVLHHMVNNILEEVFLPTFISDTYQCMVGRGTHKCIEKTFEYMQKSESTWVLKVDISKYYPSVDNELLKVKIRRKIKDKRFLKVVDDIIDSHKGLPLGNHTSQLLGNIFLNDLDHLLKGITKSYVRYADDLVIFGDKLTVKKTLLFIQEYMRQNKLKLNKSTQYFELNRRYLSFMGFRFYKHTTNGANKVCFYRPKKKNLIFKPHLDITQKASIYGWCKNSKCLIYLVKLFFNELNGTKHFYAFSYFRGKILSKDKYHKTIRGVK